MGKLVNLAGQRFGRLTVIERAGSDKRGKAMWLCSCECGKTTVVRGSDLKRGVKSCGCLQKETASKINTKDLTGMKFGKLTVIERVDERGKQGQIKWLCKCDCGNEKVVRGDGLRSGDTKSCGCLHVEKSKEKLDKLNEVQKGENHPSYKANLTDDNRKERRIQQGYDDWKQEVKRQANYTCDCCGQHGGKLCSHHLENYRDNPNKIVDINNGVCLCEQCHKDFHSYMGGYRVPCCKEDYIKFKEERKSEDAQVVASF